MKNKYILKEDFKGYKKGTVICKMMDFYGKCGENAGIPIHNKDIENNTEIFK